MPDDVCNFNKYEVSYEGPVNKTYDSTTDNSEPLYSLTPEDITKLKLLILETRPGNSFLENKHSEVQNMDILHIN